MIVAPEANQDLENIYVYISEESVDMAKVFIADLYAKMEWIAELNFTGAPRDELAEGLRALPYRKRCIYYRSYHDRVVILRVLHSAQDVTPDTFGIEDA